MRSLPVIAAAIAAAFAVSALPANAAPASGLSDALKGDAGLVVKVHGWHRYCEWGPFRYHRHIPSIGNVECVKKRYFKWRSYDDDDDDRGYWFRRNDDHRSKKRHHRDDYRY